MTKIHPDLLTPERVADRLRMYEAFERQSRLRPDDVVITRKLLEETLVTLKHARTFILTREKMHPHGVELYDELIAALEDV